MATSKAPIKWQFTEEEIREKLEELGYYNVPDRALKEFSNDLHKLITEENKESSTSCRLQNTSFSSSTLASPATTTLSNQSESEEKLYGHHVAYNGQIMPDDGDDSPGQEWVPFTRNSKSYGRCSGKENQVETQHISSQRLAQKRKVLRRKNGQAHVFDESFTNNASVTDISEVEKRLQRLPVKDDINSDSTDDDFTERSSVSQPWEKNRNSLPSFIRPNMSAQQTRGIRKMDPVSRYHEFKQEWTAKKIPGEKSHKNLRWSTRAKMLQCESFEKPRHTFIPNNYVAPTQKKRQALRWEIRSTLANC